MKKKIWIPIILGIVLIGILGLFFLLPKNNIITLDINPSMELKVNNQGMVKEIKAINEDAKEVVTSDLNNKKLEDVLDVISERILEQGFIQENRVIVILHVEGKLDINQIDKMIRESYKNMDVEIIVMDKITKEDKALAKKYHTTPAKVAYVRSIQNKKNPLSLEEQLQKSISEIKETNERGLYCEEGWMLEGDFCLKEIKREKASPGKVCPIGTYEQEGKCFEETPSIETKNLICREGFTLEGKKCVRPDTINAEPSKYTCPSGETKQKSELGLTPPEAGDANDIVCVDYSNATHPVSPCELNDGTEHMTSGGTCYWHRAPVIDSGCPGKIQVGGDCWDDASSILICAGARDGRQYSSRNEYCEDSIRYIDPIASEYKCPKGYTKENDKCTRVEEEDAAKERTCPDGFKKVDQDRCINSNEKEKVDGYVCKENERPANNMCISYEIKEAKRY